MVIIRAFLEKNAGVGELVLRLGLAVTLLISVINKFRDPEKMAKMFDMLGLGPFASSGGVIIVALGLAAVLLMLILGFYTRLAAAILIVFFLTPLLSTAGTPVWQQAKVWKDFGLLGTSVFLLFNGSRYMSLDSRGWGGAE